MRMKKYLVVLLFSLCGLLHAKGGVISTQLVAAVAAVAAKSAVTLPFVGGDIVAFKLVDGCYLHSLDAPNILHISGVDQAVNIFMHHAHFEIVSASADSLGKISFTMKRIGDNTVGVVDRAGFPRRLRIDAIPVVFVVKSYDAATKRISFADATGLIVQRDRNNYEQRRQAPPAFWDYAACKSEVNADDCTFQLIKITAPYNVFYGESNIDSFATIGSQLRSTDLKDKLLLFQKAFGGAGLVADDWLYLTRMLSEYLVRGVSFAEWPTLVVTGTTIKASDFSKTLLDLVANSTVAPQKAKELAFDMRGLLLDKNLHPRVAFAGLTTLLSKLQKIETVLNGVTSDFFTKLTYISTLLKTALSSWDIATFSADEKKMVKNIVAQAYYLCGKLAATERQFLDTEKGFLEETSNAFRALGFSKNSQWAWQIEIIGLIIRKIAADATTPSTAAATVSSVGQFLAKALVGLGSASLTQQELDDYSYKTGVVFSEAQKAKYAGAYYAGYLASSSATKDVIRDLTGCLVKIRGLIAGVDSNTYPSLGRYEGVLNYVSGEADIPVDRRTAYFSIMDIPMIAGKAEPLLCVLRVNGRYLQYTGLPEQPMWCVAASSTAATQFKISATPAATTWSTATIDATLPISVVMALSTGDVPLRCLSVARAADLGLPTLDSLLRPGKAGTPADVISLKLASPRYWLSGAASQPTTMLNGVFVPRSSWLYRLDGADKSIFAAVDPAKNQFFTTRTKGAAFPEGYVDAYISLEAVSPANPIRTAFLSIPSLESFIRIAKVDFVLDEMTKIAQSKNPSEADSFKFARSGEALSKFFSVLTNKQQVKLLSSVLG